LEIRRFRPSSIAEDVASGFRYVEVVICELNFNVKAGYALRCLNAVSMSLGVLSGPLSWHLFRFERFDMNGFSKAPVMPGFYVLECG
jgi:hypothetical protein